MASPSTDALLFMNELYETVKGDLNAKASMYEIGQALGWGKSQAGKVGEEVISLGWAEIKTLSGALGLTAEGAQTARPEGAPEATERLSLGSGRVLSAEARAAAEKILERVRERIGGLKAPYAVLEEMVLDVRTAQAQMLSPQPKTAILREILRSLQDALTRAGATDTAAAIQNMLS